MQHKQAYDFLNKLYDKIYVITIHRAAKRQERISELLNGLNYSFIYGTDKLDWTLERFIQAGIYDERSAIEKHRYKKSMNIGEVAAAQSHKQVYEDIIQNNYQSALIFEDDVVPNTNIENVDLLKSIINELPENWEVFYWGYGDKNLKNSWFAKIKKAIYHIQHKIGLLNFNHTMINNLYAKKLSTHIVKSGYQDLIHAYAVTNSGAKKLLAWNTPVVYPADTSISYAIMNNTVNAYLSVPTIFDQEVQVRPNEYISLIND
jgi:glycosyl transferase family 25